MNIEQQVLYHMTSGEEFLTTTFYKKWTDVPTIEELFEKVLEEEVEGELSEGEDISAFFRLNKK